MKPETDNRIILTLDAGGTNFVFSAIQSNKEIITPIKVPAEAHSLDKCLNSIFSGFSQVRDLIENKADAISFAFPGPADYAKGIIGNLPNFNAFNNHTPLGPLLEKKFGLPVFINNDGNLFAYGEALSGFLPEVNKRIVDEGGIKKFSNLIGLTLGTGFGGGIVLNNTLVIGDSGCGAEVHNSLNKFNNAWNAEESISTRAIQRVYFENANQQFHEKLMPREIANIALGSIEGNKNAAIEAFCQFGEAIGSSIANIITLIDGIVVLGGGITAAWDLFSPALFKEINKKYYHFQGASNDRLSLKVFNLEDNGQFRDFALGKIQKLNIPGHNTEIEFDSMPRTGIGLSQIGASHAIALGAYTFALRQLDNM
jgi:glucokinase